MARRGRSCRGRKSLYAMAKREAEKTFKQKISNHLQVIPKAIVDVNVELSPSANDDSE